VEAHAVGQHDRLFRFGHPPILGFRKGIVKGQVFRANLPYAKGF
jgi:hypothetical protein